MAMFFIWIAIATAVLFAAGYSHYRYRARNNQFYERYFTKRETDTDLSVIKDLPRNNPYCFPLLTLLIAGLLVPMALTI